MARLLAVLIPVTVVALAGFVAVQPMLGQEKQRWDCVSESVTYETYPLNILPLKIKAIMWRPRQSGPFPVLIYNHGSRWGNEHQPTLTTEDRCWRMVSGTDLVVLWPERRGYGGSTGVPYSVAMAPFHGPYGARKAIERLYDEADDVLAGLDYLEAKGLADTHRIAIMGVSLGGVVSIFAASKAPGRFHAVIDQAGGFEHVDPITGELMVASEKFTAPLLIQHAINDGLVPVKTSRLLYETELAAGKTVQYQELPAVVWGGQYRGYALDGHMIFNFKYLQYWWPKVDEFLRSIWKIQ